MDARLFFKQVKTFLSENKKMIFITACLVLVTSIAVQVLAFFIMNNNEENDYMSENMAYTHSFEIYLEQNNVGQFTNTDLLEDVLNKKDIVTEIENYANLNLQSILDSSDNTNESLDLNRINVEKHPSTNIMMVSFGVGSKEENLKIAEAYYEWLNTTQFPFFEDKQIYFMSEPGAIETIENASVNEPLNFTRVIILTVASLFAGIFLGIILSFFKAIFSKKIMYGFSYHWKEKDTFLILDNDLSTRELENSIIYPNIGNKVILSERKIDNDIVKKINQLTLEKSSLFFDTNVHHINPSLNVDEFVFIIKRKETSKEWYQIQRKQLKNYTNSLVKIIQIS
ncbi:hypothetical protein ACQKKE_10995 [Desemzia incerta]|uniref:hypothetical protein n=1 Tax=Desemzia incerta TaxID=82801 RepID=UPI003D082A4A